MSYLSDYLENMNWSPKEGQCGYRYSSTALVILHVTSAIQDDASAIEYIERVETWYPKTKVLIVEKRDAGQQEWRLIHRVEEAIAGLATVRGGADEATEEGEGDSTERGHVTLPPPVASVPTVPVVVAVPGITSPRAD